LEYMSRGTLHKIVHDPKIKLTLPRLIQFGIDTCQGMAWLHGQNIWHRDLKPENVLVDDNFVCKVADFGLSEINRQRAKKRDEDDAPGSVLWMAPEVLLNDELDNKLDVYAFALVFWETLTRKDLFVQYTDREIFTEDVARQGVRPPTDDIHPILRDILVRSWDRKPENRPSFVELIELLKKALVDIMLPVNLCPDAGKFWSKYWAGKSKAPFKSFCDAFSKEIKKLTKVQILCFEKILMETVNNESLVDIERFSNVLKWFGPLKVDAQLALSNRIEAVLGQKWFFGDIETIPAQDIVELHKDVPGTFLVRLNLGGGAKIDEAPYTITSSTLRGSFHTRCYVREKSGFIVQIKRGDEKVKITTKSNFIEDLIRELISKEPMVCLTHAPGSPFQAIFRENSVSAYFESETEH